MCDKFALLIKKEDAALNQTENIDRELNMTFNTILRFNCTSSNIYFLVCSGSVKTKKNNRFLKPTDWDCI